MQKPMRSPEENNNAPHFAIQSNFSGSTCLAVEGVSNPTTIQSLRTHFNPKLIGFGIVGLSMLDSNETKQFHTTVPAEAAFSGRNSKELK
jgi:hypothetical protein